MGTARANARRYVRSPIGSPIVTNVTPEPTAVTPWPGELLDLYASGLNSHEVGACLGISYRTVLRRIHEAGGTTRRAGPPRLPRGKCPICEKRLTALGTTAHAACLRRYPKSRPRMCECGCGTLFVPTPERVARGAGRFATSACWARWRTGRPQLQDAQGRRIGWRAAA